MGIAFDESRTKENLLRAFAGESQASNRYMFAAGVAKKNNLHLLEDVFLFTASQERSHAKVFYNYLKEVSGQNIHIDGTYPIDISEDVVALLRMAQHNEFEEFEDAYPNFAKVAKEEGFTAISKSFEMIALVEKTHGDRFGKYADMLEKKQLFEINESGLWMCLKCGHIVQGNSAPKACPICKHDQGYFVPIEYAPYTDATMIGY